MKLKKSLLLICIFFGLLSCQFNPNAPFNVVKCDDGNISGSNTQKCWDRWLIKRMTLLIPILQSITASSSSNSSPTSGAINSFFLRSVPAEISEGTAHTIYLSLANKTMPADGSSCSGGYTSPTVNKLFPNTVANVYWSSSSYDLSPTIIAWYVNFGSGNTNFGFNKNASNYLRCIR